MPGTPTPSPGCAIALGLVIAAGIAGCGSGSGVPGYEGFVKHVENNRVGRGADQWIEVFNSMGEWDRVGLIFGYAGGDYEECLKAIDGLQRANAAARYRCTPAN